VVRSYEKSEETNTKYGIDHTQSTKDRLLTKGRHRLTDSAKGRDSEDIHFGMAEKSKQVLKKHWISSASRIVKAGAEGTISKKYSDCTCQDR